MALIDYAVLTPLDEEWDTVASILFPSKPLEKTKKSITYYLTRYSADRRGVGDYLVVGAPMSRETPGEAYAAVFSTHTIEMWRPRQVALLGIAGSLERHRVILGDVVASEIIYGYEVGDVTGQKMTFRRTFNQTGAMDLDRLRALKRSKRDYEHWQNECVLSARALKLKLTRPPELHMEPSASGNYVVKSVNFGRRLRREFDKKLCAVEMEGRGLHQAVYLDAEIQDPLMIRGISDYADRAKTSLEKRTKNAWRSFAAGNAARLLGALWKRQNLAPVSPQCELDMTLGSLLNMRNPRTPPIPSIEFKKVGAQDVIFPNLIHRTFPISNLEIRVQAITPKGGGAIEYRGQCILKNFHNRSLPARDQSDGRLSFRIPSSEEGLQVELHLSFSRTVHELQLMCKDEFGRQTKSVWTNPARIKGGNHGASRLRIRRKNGASRKSVNSGGRSRLRRNKA